MRYLFITFCFSVLLFLVACEGEKIETNMSEKVGDFEFTTQNNEKLQLDDLKGEWWIADFIFTNCTSVCLPMTSNMAKLQTNIEEAGLGVQLVSFSVDPEFDSPDVLKEYGEEYGADFSSWSFLTGYEFERIKEFSTKSFRSLVVEPPPGSDQVTHGTRFFLVNPEGEVIKSYNGIEASTIDDILSDLKIVIKE